MVITVSCRRLGKSRFVELVDALGWGGGPVTFMLVPPSTFVEQ